ncbi:outer membrane protein assembly factor BamE [Litorimonas sp. RW-G-Af-16]|uniref:outer membrane protein assembly factor BamE n=1 Tax=Litorimonas sp. RW-G-Af-16 TaxID=3241168 RepID=UPI00390C8248
MTHTVLKIMMIAGFATVMAGCNPVLRTHGYVPTDEAKPQEVNPETDTKATVLARLGNPSVKSTFDEDLDEDVWFYMRSVRQRYAYLRPKIEERSITAITFNEDGQVQKVAEYGIEDGRYVNYVDRKTPTRGRELSVLEQVFGTIGRLPTDRIGGQQNVPGGGGGPGG